MVKTKNKVKSMDVLVDWARKEPNWETPKAEAMFRKFITEGFCYDDLSNNPDLTVYASAELLAFILPSLLDEMLEKKDIENFIIYHVITAIDPFSRGDMDVLERAKETIGLIDKKTEEKVFQLLMIIKNDPPIPVEQFDQIFTFWKNKIGYSTPPQV